MAWLTNYTRRKSKIINGTTAGIQADYQLSLTLYKGIGTDISSSIYFNNNIRDDFGDVRFTLSDGTTLLNYWIDPTTFVSGSTAVVWIKIPSIPASPSTISIYIYYGNSAQTSLSNIKTAFTYGDDFESYIVGTTPTGWTGDTGFYFVDNALARDGTKSFKFYDPNHWRWGGGVFYDFGANYDKLIFEWYGNTGGNVGGDDVSGIISPLDSNNKEDGFITFQNCGGVSCSPPFSWRITSAYANVWHDLAPFTTNTWYKFKVLYDTPSNRISIWINDALYVNSQPANALANIRKIHYNGRGWENGVDFWIDIFRARRYASPEPAFGASSTEEQLPGGLSVTSTPSGARIYIDNIDQGVYTPVTISNITPGTHSIKLTYTNYYDYTTNVNIISGQTTSLDATLTPLPGNLYITSTPSGARIYINNIDQLVNTPNTISNLTPGNYSVKLTLTNYYDYTTTATVNPNQTTNVSATLTPLPGNVTITSTPSGARIYIDNVDQLVNTPNTISNLTPGNHDVKLTYTNYYDYTTTVNILSSQTISINPTLSPLPGNLHVTSSPLGTRIYIDNVDQGINTEATITNLSVGDHTVKLTHPNYQDFSTTVTINPNQTTSISPSLTLSPGIIKIDLVSSFSRSVAYDLELIDYGIKRIYWNGTGVIIFEKTLVDDKIIFNVTSGTGTFTNQYSPCGGVPLSPAGPFDITSIFSSGYNDLNTQIQDMCGINIGTWGVSIDGPLTLTTNVTIDSVPTGASIVIRDSTNTIVATGTTLFSTNLIAGTYTYTISKVAYQDATGSFDVVEGVPIDFTGVNAIVLTPALGNVSITSTPSGARIYIDDIDQGIFTPNTILGLSLGTHTYKLTKIDYADSTGTFSIISGQTTLIDVTLTILPCPISMRYEGDTVHLTATPRDGIGPYYVEFRKGGSSIASYSNATENLEITYNYILTNEDIRTASLGTIDFSVFISDSCPTTPQTCTQTCIINIGCLVPVCNFTVA